MSPSLHNNPSFQSYFSLNCHWYSEFEDCWYKEMLDQQFKHHWQWIPLAIPIHTLQYPPGECPNYILK
ncbi:hypothetical protein DACRYDRAFT_112712 [Dacryopinax primogenitus]|uniref:Uncharacterized protein n=1 Tax=Dacryopinax primogenitus (strain DJM 731) TaxID=1858805 RepID=M5FMY2_DACPD|nr:uncharacterized protein DACRYDRAFT_112712 [Dacryopinax primogenitus]EJT96490.1 hypothetical protein DACRYDRAFT_112712 [Dacryopinax primogenitus]